MNIFVPSCSSDIALLHERRIVKLENQNSAIQQQNTTLQQQNATLQLQLQQQQQTLNQLSSRISALHNDFNQQLRGLSGDIDSVLQQHREEIDALKKLSGAKGATTAKQAGKVVSKYVCRKQNFSSAN